MTAARDFFETYFTPFQLANTDGTLDGLVTGYYEPLLRGARTRHGPYQYALYRWPYRYERVRRCRRARSSKVRACSTATNSSGSTIRSKRFSCRCRDRVAS